ncbi:MAG: chorismate mutase, partial [Crocinitomicaceae bacterium]
MQLGNDIKNSKRPYVIAGPCSAESPEQLLKVAQELKANGSTNLFRAGIWKPRTRPNSFEGMGDIALPWLIDVKKETGLGVTIEVANRQHTELALKAGVDVLWIGARTTVNPFAVQEIADVLRGVDIPVLIKNPVNPDLELWIGAFERLANVGITDLGAIHRGFSVYKHPKYRNVPNWEIPIALRERLPEIPIICDPSHITGNRDLLLEVSQKAMDLNFDGLMIETHPTPDKALSDAAQQLTPEKLFELFQNLILRTNQMSELDSSQLDHVRTKIGQLDNELFEILTERMNLAEVVGDFKREHNITILQQEHWEK